MEQSELNEILEKHRRWLNGDADGKRADLRYADLSDANLRRADLRYANLSSANLRYADLSSANLSNANLSRANLSNADLSNADLRYANLSRVNLSDANMDYSCLPLWCGGLKIHIDDKIAIQILYHLLSSVSYSKHVSPDIKKMLLTSDIVDLANKFHRVDECGKLEAYKSDEN